MESTISAAPQISIDREKTLRSHRRYWVLRRAQDIVFSLLALILLAPMALLISLAIVLGTEGDGLAHSTIAACDYTVKIPMSHGVDSLNVAAASAVGFWQLGRT